MSGEAGVARRSVGLTSLRKVRSLLSASRSELCQSHCVTLLCLLQRTSLRYVCKSARVAPQFVVQ